MTSPPWPYPSYADRHWLGGDRGADRALAAVVRAVRSAVADTGEEVTGEPSSLLGGLSQLAAIAERVDWAMLSLVAEGRANGVTWEAIGQSLGVSKQAAQQRFASYVKQALEQVEN